MLMSLCRLSLAFKSELRASRALYVLGMLRLGLSYQVYSHGMLRLRLKYALRVFLCT